MEQDLLRHILDISRRMAETRDLALLLNDVMDEAIQLVGAERGYVVLTEPDGSLNIHVQRDQSGQELADTEDQISRSIFRQVVEAGEPLVLKDAAQDPRFREAESVVILGLRSVMCVPLISRGDAIGAIYVENRSIRGRFRQEDVTPLVLFANQVAVAIENARLLQSLQRSHDELEMRVQERTLELSETNVLLKHEIAERKQVEDLLRAQRDLGLALSTTRGLEETLRLCGETAIRVSGMDCGGVYLVDETTGNADLAFHAGLPPDFVESVSYYDADAASVRLVMAGKPIYTRHQELGVPLDEPRRREGLRALAVIPVPHEDRVIACLNVASHTLDEVPDFARIALETIANQIGSAIARSKAEEALQQSQANLQTLFDSLEDFLFVLDMGGRIQGVNPAVVECLGYSEAELLGESVLKVHPPDRHEEAAAIVADMVAGKIDSCSVPMMTREGALIPVETRITRGRWGGREALFGISRDITERKRTEEALRVSEEKFSKAFRSSPDAITITTLQDGRYVEVNDRFLQMTGLGRQEVLGHTARGLSLWADPRERDRLMRMLREQDMVRDLEINVRAKSGVIGTVSMSAEIFELDGEQCLLAVSRDITERKRVEGLLRTQRDLGLALGATRGLEETLRLCAETAIHVSGMDCGGVYLVDETSGSLDLAFHKGLSAEFIASTSHYEADSAHARLVMVGRPIYTRHQELGVPLDESKLREGLRALAVIPIFHEDRVIAYFNVASHTLDEVSDFARIALETIATQIGNAIARSKAEEALQQSQANLQTLFDSLEDFLFVLDMEGRIQRVNPVVVERLRYSEAELLGESVLKVHPPDRHEEAAAIVADVVAGKTDSCSVPMMTREGALIPVETRITRGRWGGREALFGISRDITKRVQAEEALRRRAEELNALQATVLDITIPHDLPTLLETIVERAARLLDASIGGLYLCAAEQEQVRCVVSHNTPRDYRGTVLEFGEGAAGTVARTGEPLIIDDYRTWDGRSPVFDEEQPFRAVLAVPMTWQGQVTGVIDVVHRAENQFFTPADLELLTLFANHAAIAVENARLYEQAQQEIAERKQVEAALRESEDHLRSLFETMVEGMVLIAPDGQIVQANPAAERILGLSRSEIEARNYVAPEWEIIRPDGTLMPAEEMAGSRAMKEKHLVEDVVMGVKRPDGSISWINVGAAPLLSESGKLGGVVSTFADITERVQTEEAIQQLYEQTRRDAETKAMLLREVNHRVKNNLTSIIGLIDTERRYASAEERAVVQVAMDRLVQRIVGLAEVHDMLSQFAWTPVPLSDLATRIVSSTLHTLPLDQQVRVDVTPSPVKVSPRQANNLALVINELVTNTVKHAAPGRETAHIAVHIACEDDDTILLEYRDNGPGYPADVLRLERRGVGLYLIQNLVRHVLRGSLALVNDGGAVTTIRFRVEEENMT